MPFCRCVIAAVSELLSDVLGAHFPDFPLEDDVHVTLAGVEPAAFRIVVAFAYGGIADIPRNSVESVCEVAQLLKVKFLKDCFVKINQKEYAEIKAGKRSLQDVSQPESPLFKTPSPVRSRSRSKSPTKQVR